MNNSNMSLPNIIYGVTGSYNIVNMWKSHYEDIFNCLSNNKDVNNICKNAEYQRDVEVSHLEIIHAIKALKDNKSCGLDGISAAHLKHWSDVIIFHLFVQGILPESMISVVLVPIYSKSNFRPFALASIVSKGFGKKYL